MAQRKQHSDTWLKRSAQCNTLSDTSLKRSAQCNTLSHARKEKELNTVRVTRVYFFRRNKTKIEWLTSELVDVRLNDG